MNRLQVVITFDFNFVKDRSVERGIIHVINVYYTHLQLLNESGIHTNNDELDMKGQTYQINRQHVQQISIDGCQSTEALCFFFVAAILLKQSLES